MSNPRRVGRDVEKLRAARRAWKLRNPGKVRAANRVRAARIATWVREQKEARGCAMPGPHEGVLEWDHVTPRVVSGKRVMSRCISTWAMARRAVADPDVQVLCRMHHDEKTRSEGTGGRPRKVSA